MHDMNVPVNTSRRDFRCADTLVDKNTGALTRTFHLASDDLGTAKTLHHVLSKTRVLHLRYPPLMANL
jgi:hypothetical protein